MADRILVLVDGAVESAGTHEELLAAARALRRIVRAAGGGLSLARVGAQWTIEHRASEHVREQGGLQRSESRRRLVSRQCNECVSPLVRCAAAHESPAERYHPAPAPCRHGSPILSHRPHALRHPVRRRPEHLAPDEATRVAGESLHTWCGERRPQARELHDLDATRPGSLRSARRDGRVAPGDRLGSGRRRGIFQGRGQGATHVRARTRLLRACGCAGARPRSMVLLPVHHAGRDESSGTPADHAPRRRTDAARLRLHLVPALRAGALHRFRSLVARSRSIWSPTWATTSTSMAARRDRSVVITDSRSSRSRTIAPATPSTSSTPRCSWRTRDARGS